MGEPSKEIKLIISKLDDWEKVYFFAGVWKERYMTGIRSKSISEIVQGYIKTGIDFLHKSHMIKKAEGTYRRKLKLPRSQNYRKEQTELGRVAARFQELLSEDDGNLEVGERIAMFLDGCSEDQLRYLTKRFDHENLAGYVTE